VGITYQFRYATLPSINLDADPDTTPPSRPQGLSASERPQGIALSWSANSEPDLAGYRLYRSTSSATGFTLIASLTTVSYLDTTAAPAVTYYYRLYSFDAADNESTSYASASAIRVDNAPPGAPTGLTATDTGSGVQLTWTANPETDLAGYRLQRATSAGGSYTLLGPFTHTATSYLDAAVAAGNTYFYRLYAVDTAGNVSVGYASISAAVASGDVTAPAAPGTITFTPTANYIAMDWPDNAEGDLAGYNVYRAAIVGGPYTKLNAALVGPSAYDDTTAPIGQLSYYRVTAVDASGNESTPSSGSSTRPNAGAWPSAANTGPSCGSGFTHFYGTYVPKSGQTVSCLVVHGSIDARNTSNVKILDCIVDGGHDNLAGTTGASIGVRCAGATNLLVERCEIRYVKDECVTGAATVRNCNLHHSGGDGIKPKSGSRIESNWFHHLGYGSPLAHADGIQIRGESNIYITGNNFDMPKDEPNTKSNANVLIQGQNGEPSNSIVIDGNLCGHGNFTMVAFTDGGTPSSIRITNNRFLRNTAQYGFGNLESGVVWSGNVYDDNGATASAKGK
jgi:fibronectin type 3 domain-containing protein